MRESLLIIAAAAALLAGVAWVAGLGGEMELRFGEWLIAAPLAVAAAAGALAFLLGHGVLAGLGALLRRGRQRGLSLTLNRRAEADRALTEAMMQIAIGAPDAARAAADRARALSGNQPVALMVAAAAARMAGHEDAAAAHYRALADQPETRILGLRGLLRQAVQRGDRQAELALAAAAEAAHPGAAQLARDGTVLPGPDLQSALAMTVPEAPRAARLLAEAAAEPDQDKAMRLEREAFAADPAFPPAVLAHATRLRHAGHQEAARAVLEVGWAAAPHPDLAQAHLLPHAEGPARATAAEALARHHPNHPEARLMLGRALLGAGHLARARPLLEGLAGDRRAHQAMAELARRQGEPAEAARHLDAALAAPAPEGWRCGACGAQAERWTPACQSCGAPLALAWRAASHERD